MGPKIPISSKSRGLDAGKSCSLHGLWFFGLFLAHLGHVLIIWLTSATYGSSKSCYEACRTCVVDLGVQRLVGDKKPKICVFAVMVRLWSV